SSLIKLYVLSKTVLVEFLRLNDPKKRITCGSQDSTIRSSKVIKFAAGGSFFQKTKPLLIAFSDGSQLGYL
ncbi:MAG: hypothetical protein ACJAUL_002133, partial [Paraglaciecola sp.]